MLIKDPVQRAARVAEKRHAVLRFLRDELYTTPAVIAELLQCGSRATRQTIAAMERDDLLKRHTVKVMPQLPPVVVVGITPHGQGLAFDPAAGETPRPHFEPSRVSMLTLQHTVDLQLLRLRSVYKWSKWINSDRLQKTLPGVKKPDAICLTVGGQRTAIECERTIKSRQRYVGFIAGHLTAIRQKKWSRVIVAAPTADLAERLKTILAGVSVVDIQGERIKLDDAARAAFIVCTYADFPGVL